MTISILTMIRHSDSTCWTIELNGDFKGAYVDHATASERLLKVLLQDGGQPIVAYEDQNSLTSRVKRQRGEKVTALSNVSYTLDQSGDLIVWCRNGDLILRLDAVHVKRVPALDEDEVSPVKVLIQAKAVWDVVHPSKIG